VHLAATDSDGILSIEDGSDRSGDAEERANIEEIDDRARHFWLADRNGGAAHLRLDERVLPLLELASGAHAAHPLFCEVHAGIGLNVGGEALEESKRDPGLEGALRSKSARDRRRGRRFVLDTTCFERKTLVVRREGQFVELRYGRAESMRHHSQIMSRRCGTRRGPSKLDDPRKQRHRKVIKRQSEHVVICICEHLCGADTVDPFNS
jgi:hypothetical protein